MMDFSATNNVIKTIQFHVSIIKEQLIVYSFYYTHIRFQPIPRAMKDKIRAQRNNPGTDKKVLLILIPKSEHLIYLTTTK